MLANNLALPRLKTRTKKWLGYISWTLLAILTILSVWYFLNGVAFDDNARWNSYRQPPKEIDLLNVQLQPDFRHLKRAATTPPYHGDLSNLPLPADWHFKNFKKGLRFPLDREPMDARHSSCKNVDYALSSVHSPPATVIFIFCNEPFETLLRSVHSVLNTSPPSLLHEIILVDDGSDVEYISEPEGLLASYVKLLPKVRLVRQGKRSGIVQARLRGIAETRSDIFVVLDSHIECQPGWLEPLLFPIIQNPSIVTMPQIDGIHKATFELQAGGVGCTLGLIWNMMEHAINPLTREVPAIGVVPESLLKFGPVRDRKPKPPSPLAPYESESPDSVISTSDRRLPNGRKPEPTKYVSSPAMAGGLFAANKEWFLRIGGYDERMIGWGAENVEFSLRLWQCGGKLLCTECSRVNHMFGGGKFYTTEHNSATVNRMRTIAAWLRGEYADLSWHVLGRPRFSEIGNVSNIEEIQKRLKCKNFNWFLDNVYPESYVRRVPEDVPYLGPLVNLGSYRCLRNSFRGSGGADTAECSASGAEFGHFTQIYWRRPGYITVEESDETCIVAKPSGDKTAVQWDWCGTPWIVEELAVYDAEKAEVHPLGSAPEETLSAFKVARNSIYSHPKFSSVTQSFGNLVLVRIRLVKDRAPVSPEDADCLAEDPGTGTVKVQKCSFDAHSVWLWTNYKFNSFWVENGASS